MLVLIIYDVPDDKRRLKLATFLEGYGRRVQKSAFECFMNLDEMRKLYQKVKRQVDLQEDNIRFYWISAEAVTRVLTLGSDDPQPPPNVYII